MMGSCVPIPTPALSHLDGPLALIIAWRAYTFQSLCQHPLSWRPACPNCWLSLFLADSLMCSSNHWSKLQLEAYTQGWGRSHTWASGPCDYGRNTEISPYRETWCYTATDNFLNAVPEKTTERTTCVSVVGTGLALAAVGFVSAHM